MLRRPEWKFKVKNDQKAIQIKNPRSMSDIAVPLSFSQ
jgi:hypothetical protein